MVVRYSGKPLIGKLGLKSGFCARIVNAPDHYWALLGPLPSPFTLVDDGTDDLDFIHCFATRRADLEAAFPALQTQLGQRGMLWVSWPKAAAKMETDLHENIVRAIGLRGGLVDVKVCAVDAHWSGLKFVRRLKDRQ
jgi:hypothetical protein